MTISAEEPTAAPSRADLEGLIRLAKTGPRRLALETVQRFAARWPDSFDGWTVVLACFRRLGQTVNACEAAQHAVTLAPRNPNAHSNLGVTLKDLGRLNEAEAAYRRALALKPDSPEVYYNMGVVLQELSRLNEAEQAYRQAIALRPPYEAAYSCLGNVLQQLGRPHEAESACRRALALKPNYAEALNNLASVYLSLGRPTEAEAALRQAIRSKPHLPVSCRNYTAMLATHAIDANHPEAKEIIDSISHCVSFPEINLEGACKTALKLLFPTALQERVNTHLANPGASPLWFLHDPGVWSVLSSPLFLLTLKNYLVANTWLEELLTYLRRQMAVLWVAESLAVAEQEQLEPLAIALGSQCFLNEYVWDLTDQEQALQQVLLATLRTGLASAASQRLGLGIGLAGSYWPLVTIPEMVSWFQVNLDSLSEPLRTLLTLHIAEPLREQAILQGIPRLTPIANGVSHQVRQQYEENPYPRWFGMPRIPLQPFTRILQEQIAPNRLGSLAELPAPEILVAGCGTGKHPIRISRVVKGARVTAMDLSLASLAYAQRKAEEMKVDIRFMQGDILNLDGLPLTFDVIECSGVLHHMADPEAGLRSLLRRLRAGGFLKLGLYSEIARRDVVNCREWIAAHQIPPTPSGIRTMRGILKRSSALLSNSGIGWGDFYSMSRVRDLLFHVQEWRYTLPALAALLERNGLQFLGFTFTNPSIKQDYLRCFPADPMATSLENWAQYETANPSTFFNMYQFWCRIAKTAAPQSI